MGIKVEPGITVTLTVGEWRDIRDALHDWPHNVMRVDRAALVQAVSAKIREATGNPMD